MKKSIIDFSKELNESSDEINDLNGKIKSLIGHSKHQTNTIEDMKKELYKLGTSLNLDLQITRSELNFSERLEFYDQAFLELNYDDIETKVRKEILKNPELFPKLSHLDLAVACISGIVAAVLDILFVKLPKDMNYLSKYSQEGSSFTKWLRTLGVDEKGNLKGIFKKCEELCKVPYDMSVSDKSNNKVIEGLYPLNHRMLSLAHDPLFGMIFGIIDIFNGSITAFDKNGMINIIKTYDADLTTMVLSPLIWVGHLVSDLCTRMGLPIPGWGITQLMQFGSFGEKNRTIAELAQFMYLKGYDLRHFLTMSISAASIEMIVRGYCYLLSAINEEFLDSAVKGIAQREEDEIKEKLRLHKMLFIGHSIAASGNGIKVLLDSGNPLAINAAQWGMFINESINIVVAAAREKTPEKIERNRKKLKKSGRV